MRFEEKNESGIILKHAKDLFFRYGGNLRAMSENEEAYKEYRKLKISAETQKKWLEELFDHTLDEMHGKTGAYEKMVFIETLSSLGVKTEQLFSLIVNLLNEKMDTFTRLLLCECLKKLRCESISFPSKTNVLEMQKTKMLKESISIDERYFHLSYMSTYDFSNSNIKKRVELL